jgi:heptosyltransferase II
MKKNKTPMTLLLVQTSFLGDTILSTPVISALASLYPNARLWMMTTPLSQPLVARDPLLTGVLTFDKRGASAGLRGLVKMSARIRRFGFDRVYALHRSTRTSLLLFAAGIPHRTGFQNARLKFLYHDISPRSPRDHDVIRNLSILSNETDMARFDAELRLFAPERKELGPAVGNKLPEAGKYVLLVPGSAWKTKMWHWQGYRQVAQYMLNRGFSVVLMGSGADREVNARVGSGLPVMDVAGHSSVSDAMYLVKHAALVICNDSMALHLASAFKVPTVAVFCATSPDFGFGPWKNRAIVVEKKDLACKPCRRHGSMQCPNGTHACMTSLGSDQVIQAAEALLESP